ncbi:MAG: nucleotide exchange factor GrpE [Steroidobacteraceae bacterium]|jgi:molecular chaperone GrpE|nr:nucleotide exchange factor GrpE [Steroidobacteraceae bacterium]
MSSHDPQFDPSRATPPPADDPEATAVLPENSLRPGVAALEKALAEATAKADENFALYVRALAEVDNVRKRTARDVEQAARSGVEKLAQELLPAMDSFEMAAAAGANADARSLLEGQAATLRLLQKAFEKAGIQAVDPTGQPFDPERHEAMVAQPTADAPPDTVLQTIQKGYVLQGRLLRPARVIVARAPG